MNFFRIPKEYLTKEELAELIHLYTYSHLPDDPSQTAQEILREFHSRQPVVGISDERLQEMILITYQGLSPLEKNYTDVIKNELDKSSKKRLFAEIETS